MEFLLKTLSPQLLLALAPMICLKVGSWFKNKDVDSVGKDDAAGNFFIALAPAIAALEDKNENAFKKALRAVRTTIDGYLGDEK